MRMARKKTEGVDKAFYHCVSHLLDHRLLSDEEKDHFIELMRGYETFCGVRVVSYCVMFDHFHVLVEVPRRPSPEALPDDRELVRRARKAQYSYDSQQLRKDLAQVRAEGAAPDAEALREQLFARMWDVSWFMKMLKQRFTQWYNRRNQRHGTLWEERYRSLPVQAENLLEEAIGIDLNPVRHGIARSAEDYCWSNFGQAANGVREAREGLRIALEAHAAQKISPQRVLPEYRAHLQTQLAEEPHKNGNGNGKNGKSRKGRLLSGSGKAKSMRL